MTEVVSHERFASVVKVQDEQDDRQSTSIDVLASPTTIALTSLATSSSNYTIGMHNTSTKAIVDLINDYHLREVSLSASHLSDELLIALSNSSSSSSTLKTLRVEAHPELKPYPAKISIDVWSNFSKHHPHMNLVVSSYMTKEDDFESIIAAHIPVTHLYLGESTPSSVVAKIADNCPRLVELVIGSYASDTLDQILESTAKGCPELSALALGECEITCTGFVKFVELCCKRLQVLYVWETSLLEDSNYDLTQLISTVSTLLGRSWQPEYIPVW